MKKEVLLIGDSITAGFDTAKFFSKHHIVNKGVSGDSTAETLERIDENWFASEPDLIFICIGTNDFARERSDEFILSNISEIVIKIEEIYPAGKIFITSIFPTRENPIRPNFRIIAFNNKLKYLSDQLKVGYFNLHSHFVDETGAMDQKYTDDGLHLTDTAYEHWANLLNDFLDQL